MTKKSLDLGSGPRPKNPYNADIVIGVDIREGLSNVVRANLVYEPIPFENDSFDFLTAFDFIEHIPRVISIYDSVKGANQLRFPFIELMNEIYRVLRPGGIFFSSTPAFPHSEAFQDPTHVNIITEKTFLMYFNDHYPVAHIYGFVGGFKIIAQEWDGAKLVVKMVKSERPDLERFVSG